MVMSTTKIFHKKIHRYALCLPLVVVSDTFCVLPSDKNAGGVTFRWPPGFLEPLLSIPLGDGLSVFASVAICSFSGFVVVFLCTVVVLGVVVFSRCLTVVFGGAVFSDTLGNLAGPLLITVVLHILQDRGHLLLVSKSIPQSPLAAKWRQLSCVSLHNVGEAAL